MQGGEEEVHPLRYELRGMGHSPEDILFCVDADAEVSVEMKVGTQGKGLCRLDAIKQAIILFVHSKLMANAHHRFAFATLRKSASWVWLLLMSLGHVSITPVESSAILWSIAGYKLHSVLSFL